jgi:hypothetical protein
MAFDVKTCRVEEIATLAEASDADALLRIGIESITEQLFEADELRRTKGIEPGSVWLRRARDARRALQMAKARLVIRRREIREQGGNAITFSEAFVQVVRDRVSAASFAKLERVAHDRLAREAARR